MMDWIWEQTYTVQSAEGGLYIEGSWPMAISGETERCITTDSAVQKGPRRQILIPCDIYVSI